MVILTTTLALLGQLQCSQLKDLYAGLGSFETGGTTCCEDPTGSLDLNALPCSKSVVRTPTLTRVVTPSKSEGNTYAGAVHGDTLFYTNAHSVGYAGSDDVALFAYDTNTDQKIWEVKYSELVPASFQDVFAQVAPTATMLLRNTPFIDAEHDRIWINDAEYLGFISSFNMTTGEQLSFTLIDPTDPYGPLGNVIRTGVVVEYEKGVPVGYLGRGQNYKSYGAVNFFDFKQDVHMPGTFAPAGFMGKYNLIDGSPIWKVNTMPEELTAASGVVPDECFRPGTDTVTVLTEFKDGYVFEDAATYKTDGTRELWDHVAKRVLTFEFSNGDVFNTSASYTSKDGTVTVSGADLVWDIAKVADPSHPFTMLDLGTKSAITKELKRGFDLTDHPWEAYHLNYYGAKPWAQGIKVTDDAVIFGTGNSAQVPLDESLLFEDSNMILDTNEYATGKISRERLAEKMLERKQVPKSARGKRAWFNAIVALKKTTGEPIGVVQTTPYDNAHGGMWGGMTLPYDPSKTGQPQGEPYHHVESSDMDIGVGTVEFSNGNFGIFNKASYGFIFHPSHGGLTASRTDDMFMDHGVASLREMTVGQPVHVGMWSWLGGVNYAISTDGERMFGVVRNTGGAGEHLTQPQLTVPAYGLFDIPTGVPYMVAVNKDGTVAWVTPLEGATAVSGTAVHDGRVYTTMFQDNDQNFVYEITTDDRDVRNRRGIVYELDAETGAILHKGKSVAGALWAPNVLARDKIYTFNGLVRSFAALHGQANVIEKFDFSD